MPTTCCAFGCYNRQTSALTQLQYTSFIYRRDNKQILKSANDTKQLITLRENVINNTCNIILALSLVDLSGS